MADITFTLDLENAQTQAQDFLKIGASVCIRPAGHDLFALEISLDGGASGPSSGGTTPSGGTSTGTSGTTPSGPSPGGPATSDPTRPSTTLPGRGLLKGDAILDIAKRHVGQKYGHKTPNYEDPLWRGEFDCAEYVSYCAYRAYRILFGTRPRTDARRADAYTGYWKEDVLATSGAMMSVQEALRTPGAIALRFPPRGEPMGHIAMCIGDGDAIYEAHSTNRGIIKGTAKNRRWDTGVKLPGVDYGGGVSPAGSDDDPLIFRLLDPPAAHDPVVEKLQTALQQLGLLTTFDINGIYDHRTYDAVVRFQDQKGLLVDGEVGPDTGLALLGAAWNDVQN